MQRYVDGHGSASGLRIAHVSDGYLPRLGGIERQVAGLSRLQSARGDQVDVITSVADPNADAPPGHALGSPRVLRPAPRDLRIGRIEYARSIRACRSLDFSAYDIVHIHASTFSPLAYLAARSARRHSTPTVLTLHSLWSGASPLFTVADRLLGWSRWPVRWSAVSTVAARSLADHVGPEVSVLPNGVDSAFWRTPDRRHPRPEHLSVVTVMRLAHRKRPLPFVAMLRALRDRLAPAITVSVRVIGDGPLRRAMDERISAAGLSSWVHMTGQLSSTEIRAALATADVYVAPAVHESFGIAALEAHSAGVPVVAFGHSGVRDIIVDGETGRLVDDDATMVDALEQLALDPALRMQLARGARSAFPCFDWPEVLRHCDDLYSAARAQRGLEGQKARR